MCFKKKNKKKTGSERLWIRETFSYNFALLQTFMEGNQQTDLCKARSERKENFTLTQCQRWARHCTVYFIYSIAKNQLSLQNQFQIASLGFRKNSESSICIKNSFAISLPPLTVPTQSKTKSTTLFKLINRTKKNPVSISFDNSYPLCLKSQLES